MHLGIDVIIFSFKQSKQEEWLRRLTLRAALASALTTRSSPWSESKWQHQLMGVCRGSFATVRKGRNRKTGEKVAVKVLEKSKIKDKKDVERISREIKILKKLHHPAVV